MLLSIIVPVYNCERFLERCLSSLINQSLADDEFEILLVDDGSTDGSLRILESYKKLYKQVKILTQPNSGQAVARNKALDVAKGRYIHFVDADDYVALNCYRQLIEQADSLDTDILVFRHRDVHGVDMEFFESEPPTNSVVHDGISYMANCGYVNTVWLSLIKREFLENLMLRFEPGRYFEDVIFITELISSAERVSYYPLDVYRYYVNPDSTMSRKGYAHMRKTVDDYMFVNYFFTAFIKEKYAMEIQNSAYFEALERLRARSVYYLLLRIIRARYDGKTVKCLISELKLNNSYPVTAINHKDLTPKDRIILKLLNNQYLFLGVCKLYNLLPG